DPAVAAPAFARPAAAAALASVMAWRARLALTCDAAASSLELIVAPAAPRGAAWPAAAIEALMARLAMPRASERRWRVTTCFKSCSLLWPRPGNVTQTGFSTVSTAATPDQGPMRRWERQHRAGRTSRNDQPDRALR